MSCDWDVHCVSCGVSHGFSDANHMDAEMLALCRHADDIAAIADSFAAIGGKWYLTGDRNSIRPAWFKEHMGHQLMPIDEYGRLLDQCYENVTCDAGHSHPCQLRRDHDGDCSGKQTPR